MKVQFSIRQSLELLTAVAVALAVGRLGAQTNSQPHILVVLIPATCGGALLAARWLGNAEIGHACLASIPLAFFLTWLVLLGAIAGLPMRGAHYSGPPFAQFATTVTLLSLMNGFVSSLLTFGLVAAARLVKDR